MKKFFYVISALLLSVIVTSCGDDNQEPVSGGNTTLYATIESDKAPQQASCKIEMSVVTPDEGDDMMPMQRISINPSTYAFNWAGDDKISVFSSHNQNLVFACDKIEDDVAAFNGNLPDGETLGAVAYYPYDAVHTSTSIYLPNVYDYKFDNSPAVMTADIVDGENLMFKHLGAMLCVSFDEIPEGYNQLVFSVDDNVNITGVFSVQSSNGEKFISTGNGGNAVTLNFANESGLSETKFYIPLPVANYSKMQVDLVNRSVNKHFTKGFSTSSPTSLNRRDLIEFPSMVMDIIWIYNGNERVGCDVYNEKGLEKAFAYANGHSAININLMNDITVSSGKVYNIASYGGVFNGNGHTIEGINQTLPLISTLNETGRIDGLTLSGVVINNGEDKYVGAFVGNNLGSVFDCHVMGESSSIRSTYSRSCAGGIVGFNAKDVFGCSVYGLNIAADYYAGGIAGSCSDGINIFGCSVGDVILEATRNRSAVGGVAGISGEASVIAFCLVKNVEMTGSSIGGLVSNLDFEAQLVSCYSYITSSSFVDEEKLFGFNDEGVVIGCYYYNGGSVVSADGVAVSWTDAVNAMNSQTSQYGVHWEGDYNNPILVW